MQGDAAKLQQAFHADAQMYGAVGADRYDEPIAEYVKLVAESPGGATLAARITSIEQAGDAAAATVVEEGFWGTLSFVTFFTLARIDGRWRIVNKTFGHTGGEHALGRIARPRRPPRRVTGTNGTGCAASRPSPGA